MEYIEVVKSKIEREKKERMSLKVYLIRRLSISCLISDG